MAHNYYVTAHKPTGVHLSASGNFTSPSELNLIMAKTTRLEIHLITSDGLRPLLDVGVYGRIAVVKLFRPEGEEQDLMLVVTERYRVMVLGYDSQKSEIVTRAFGDVQDRVGRPSETGIIAAIDPGCKIIALRLYDGQLKIIQLELDSGHDLRAYTIRLLELHAVDLDFLHCCPVPTLALIYQDVNGRHLKAYELLVKDKDLGKDVWSARAVETEATMLITVPGPLGGALVIGQESVTYYTEKSHIPIAPPEFVTSPVISYGQVDADGSRYLLGDMQGRLFMLLLDKEEQMEGSAHVRELKISVLGEVRN